MSHKYNADRRHRISKRRYKVTNWRDYEAGLRKRGSLTIWFSEDAVEAWRAEPRPTPGGQLGSCNRDVADPEDSVSPAAAPDRRGSLLELKGLDLPVPDHSTLGRRDRTLAVAPQAASGPVHLLVDSTGVKLSEPGEWLVEKHEPSAAAPSASCISLSMPRTGSAEAAVVVPPRSTAVPSPSAETDPT